MGVFDTNGDFVAMSARRSHRQMQEQMSPPTATVSTTTTTAANETNGAGLTDDGSIALRADKIAMVYKLRCWHEVAEPTSFEYIPVGVVVSDLTGSEYVILRSTILLARLLITQNPAQ